jgi:hypothetical protein
MIKENLLEKFKTISKGDIDLYAIEDDENQILEIIKASRIRNGDDSLR